MAKRLPIGKPGFDGRMEIVGDVVDSPYRRGEKEPVVRNIQESSLSSMFARGTIDAAQYRAGDWMRGQFERMRMGSGAIDPSYEPVDTSGHSDPIPDRLLRASLAIHDAREAVTKEVGLRGWLLLECVCVEGCAIAEAARRRYGLPTQGQSNYVGSVFRDSLNVLATHLGLATT